MRCGTVVPDCGEVLSLQLFSRLHRNVAFHKVSARWLVTGVSGHIVHSDRRASSFESVWGRAVPCQAVVEKHLARLYGTGDHMNLFAGGEEGEIRIR